MDKKAVERVKIFAQKLPFSAKVYLFGSRARDDYLVTSDFDVIIVSDYFYGMPFHKRPVVVSDFWNWDTELEVLCYTNAEFETMKNRITMIRSAMKDAILVS